MPSCAVAVRPPATTSISDEERKQVSSHSDASLFLGLLGKELPKDVMDET